MTKAALVWLAEGRGILKMWEDIKEEA